MRGSYQENGVVQTLVRGIQKSLNYSRDFITRTCQYPCTKDTFYSSMNFNFENRDKQIRDIKEGEPRFEV